MMLNVDLRYYAQLREQAGTGGERVATRAASVGQLYAQLQEMHGFSLPPEALKVAVNTRFCGWDEDLHEGDTVVFIPPVNGG